MDASKQIERIRHVLANPDGPTDEDIDKALAMANECQDAVVLEYVLRWMKDNGHDIQLVWRRGADEILMGWA